MDCYKIKHFVQYTSEDYTSDSMTQQTTSQMEEKANEGDYGQQLKEPKEMDQSTIHPEANMQ
jgi:hypothetical protein